MSQAMKLFLHHMDIPSRPVGAFNSIVPSNTHNVQYAGLCAFCSVSVLRNAVVKKSGVVGRIWVIFVCVCVCEYVSVSMSVLFRCLSLNVAYGIIRRQ